MVNHKDFAGTYGSKKDYVTITRKGNAYAVRIHTAGGKKAPDDWECQFEGETSLEGNVLSFKEPAFTVTISANKSGPLWPICPTTRFAASGERPTAISDGKTMFRNASWQRGRRIFFAPRDFTERWQAAVNAKQGGGKGGVEARPGETIVIVSYLKGGYGLAMMPADDFVKAR